MVASADSRRSSRLMMQIKNLDYCGSISKEPPDCICFKLWLFCTSSWPVDEVTVRPPEKPETWGAL